MTLSSALLGGAFGTGIHMFANATRKVPLSRQPWCHVGYFFIGMYLGNNLIKWERSLLEEINEFRSDRGMAPMVGSSSYYPLLPSYTDPGRPAGGDGK